MDMEKEEKYWREAEGNKPPVNPNYRLFSSFITNDYVNQHFASVSQLQRRWMISSKTVQDRSRFKRVRDLEMAAEKHKVFAKVLYLLEILKEERENIVTLKSLDWHRHHVNLPKPNMFSDFLRKVPKLSKVHRAS